MRDQEEWLGSSIQLPGLVPLNDYQGTAGITRLAITFKHKGKQSIEEILQIAIEGASRLVQVYRWLTDKYYVRPIIRADITHAKILYLDANGEPINQGTLVGPPGPYGPPPALNPELVNHLKTALLDGSNPRIEHRLLHEAARALHYGDFPWSAFNAITALEIAVSHPFLKVYALNQGISWTKWKGVVNDLTESRIKGILTPLLFDEPPAQQATLIRLLKARHKSIHKGAPVQKMLASEGFKAVKLYLDKINALRN
ncbi:MAG: hypothetical protein WA996_15395 [Candidatus Promineifilaceae bacterium]